MISKNRNIFISLIAFLAILIPPALVTGPFLPDLFISFMGITYIGLNYDKNNKLKNLYQNKPIIFFFSFYFFVIISTIFSYQPLVSIESSLFYFRFLFFSLAILFILQNYNNFIKYLIISFSITFIIIYFDSFLQFTFGNNLTGYPIDDHGGINSFFGTNADGILGSYMVRVSPIFCSLIAYKYINLKYTKYIILLILIFASIITLFSQERTAFALSIIPLFAFIFCTKEFRFHQKILLLFIFILLISLVIFLNHDIFLRFFTSINDQIFSNKKIFIFSELHQAHYLSALKMFIVEPFTGIGPKMFRFYCDSNLFYVQNACSTHPHNTYIQLLGEAGIFSFLFIFGLFLIVISIILKQYFFLLFKNRSIYKTHYILIISSLLISLWPLAPTANFFNNWINVIYYFPIGFILYFTANNETKS